MLRYTSLIFISIFCMAFSASDDSNNVTADECLNFYNHFDGLPNNFILESRVSFDDFCLQGSGSNPWLEDDTTFTNADLAYITRQQKHPVVNIWKTGQINRATIIEPKELHQIFTGDDIDGGWKRFYKMHPGKGFYILGVPLFSIKKDRCIAYVSNFCGGLCGAGEMYFCIKQGDKWVTLRTYRCWIS